MSASLEERLPALYDSVSGPVDAPRDVYCRLQFLSRLMRSVSVEPGESLLAWQANASDVATYRLGATPVVIGRSPDCEIVLPAPRASRRHCQIVRESETVSVCDLGSTNGTLVNGVRITDPRPLTDGDVIEVGGAALAFLRR